MFVRLEIRHQSPRFVKNRKWLYGNNYAIELTQMWAYALHTNRKNRMQFSKLKKHINLCQKKKSAIKDKNVTFPCGATISVINVTN